MSSNSSSSSGGIGIFSVLFIVFLVLKLTGNIDWSWWWVTAPLWLPVAVGGAVVAIVATFIAIGRALR